MKTTPVCAYCGKKWPKHKGDVKDIPIDIADEIKKHIQECPENPLAKKVGQLKSLLSKAHYHLCSNICPVWKTSVGQVHHELCIEIKQALKGGE